MGQAPVTLYNAALQKNWTELDKLLGSATKTSLNCDGYRHVREGKLDNRNVLHLAIEYHAPLNLIAKILTVGIPKGLDIDATNRNNETALQSALRYNAGPEVVNLLLDHGACLSYRLLDSLQFDHSIGAREFAMTILEHPRAKNEFDTMSRLVCAARMQFPPDFICKDLKGAEKQLNMPDSEGRNLLHIACESQFNPKENLGLIRLLLDNGANIHATTSEEWTPLHVAARNGASLNIVQLLLERGADPNALDVRGKTPLHLAMQANEPHLFSILDTTNSVLEALPVKN